MRVRNIVCVAVVAFLVLAAQVRAAVIAYSGSVEGTQVNDWRTSTTAKTMDLDGNNVYGSMGAMDETYTPAGQQSSGGSTTLGWAFGGGGTATFTTPGYAQVDDIFTPATKVTAGACFDWTNNDSWFNFYLTGVASDYAGKTVRVAVMQDIMDAASQSSDSHKTLQVTQLVGGTGDSGLVSVRGGAGGSGAPEFYFFDITGAGPGDEFKIFAPNAAGYFPGYIGPVAWDIASVPEPSTITLLAAGLISLLAYAWRKRK